METVQDLHVLLKGLLPVFQETAVSCLNIMFQKKIEIAKPWEVAERLDGQFTHLVTMGCANSDFKSLILVGISETSVVHLLDEDVDLKYLADVLGEFVNSYCAFLDDSEAYSSLFGKQIQAVPMLYSGGAPFISFLWGVQGVFRIGGGELYMGYVIQRSGEHSAEAVHG